MLKPKKKFLLKAKQMLAKKGKIFLSTCANCAQIDHLYHFKCINEIQNLIKLCKLRIESELISPSENIPKKNGKKKKLQLIIVLFLVEVYEENKSFSSEFYYRTFT